MTGTSMAAPFAAGIAAALMELHPEWSAREVSSAIVGSAHDLGQSVFSQGRGGIDTSAAFGTSVIAMPGTMSFGFDVSKTAQWMKTDTLTLSNPSSDAKTYSLSSISSAVGIRVQCTPSSVTIPAFGTAHISVALSADNASLPNSGSLASAYSGMISARSATDSILVPFVFFKGTLLQMTFSETPLQVLVHNRQGTSYACEPNTQFVSLALPEGTYDIITSFFGNAFVVREDVTVSGATESAISRDEAIYCVTIDPCDEAGRALTPSGTTTYSYIEAIKHFNSGVSQLLMSGGIASRA
jgi:hypothetical protein